MKKLFLTPFFAVLLATASLIWFSLSSLAPSKDGGFKNFIVEGGSSASQIGLGLKNAGFIKSPLAFKIYVQFTGKASQIQAGEYRLSPNYSLFQIVSQLTKGPLEIWVTIPEGLRREEIANKFAKALDQGSEFESEFLASSTGEEGFLFPDTYLFPKEASASSIVNKMIKNFNSKTASLKAGSGLTFDQRIILASLIERETKTAEERSVVSGILINRLNAGMPLQIDATVQYAAATSRCKFVQTSCSWWEPLASSDLTLNSSYNTYLNPGLPPAPIANPGLSSIQAAFDPAKTDYWYYIHDGQGQIHYAKTLDEQNANIDKYLH